MQMWLHVATTSQQANIFDQRQMKEEFSLIEDDGENPGMTSRIRNDSNQQMSRIMNLRDKKKIIWLIKNHKQQTFNSGGKSVIFYENLNCD